jgi:hypothetical protein
MGSMKTTPVRSVSYLIALSVLSFCVSYKSASCSHFRRCSLTFGRSARDFNRASSSSCGSITSSRSSDGHRRFLMTAVGDSGSSSSSKIGFESVNKKSTFQRALNRLTFSYLCYSICGPRTIFASEYF